MNKINRQLKGEFKMGPYLKIERFSILASVLFVVMASMCIPYIKTLLTAEYKLMPGFFTVGYFGQSLGVAAFGKAADVVTKITGAKICEPVSTQDESGLT